METSATRTLLESYYEAFARKSGWEQFIADDFEFVGGDMTNISPLVGNGTYQQVIARFSRVFTDMRVKQMIVDGGNACVIGNYDYVFPNGAAINGDVAEIWTAKNGRLQTLRIYFDTLTFARNTPS